MTIVFVFVWARLGVSRPIYVAVDSPNLGFCFNFLGGYQLKKTPCITAIVSWPSFNSIIITILPWAVSDTLLLLVVPIWYTLLGAAGSDTLFV